jgi:hypothetical protein
MAYTNRFAAVSVSNELRIATALAAETQNSVRGPRSAIAADDGIVRRPKPLVS